MDVGVTYHAKEARSKFLGCTRFVPKAGIDLTLKGFTQAVYMHGPTKTELGSKWSLTPTTSINNATLTCLKTYPAYIHEFKAATPEIFRIGPVRRAKQKLAAVGALRVASDTTIDLSGDRIEVTIAFAGVDGAAPCYLTSVDWLTCLFQRGLTEDINTVKLNDFRAQLRDSAEKALAHSRSFPELIGTIRSYRAASCPVDDTNTSPGSDHGSLDGLGETYDSDDTDGGAHETASSSEINCESDDMDDNVVGSKRATGSSFKASKRQPRVSALNRTVLSKAYLEMDFVAMQDVASYCSPGFNKLNRTREVHAWLVEQYQSGKISTLVTVLRDPVKHLMTVARCPLPAHLPVFPFMGTMQNKSEQEHDGTEEFFHEVCLKKDGTYWSPSDRPFNVAYGFAHKANHSPQATANMILSGSPDNSDPWFLLSTTTHVALGKELVWEYCTKFSTYPWYENNPRDVPDVMQRNNFSSTQPPSSDSLGIALSVLGSPVSVATIFLALLASTEAMEPLKINSIGTPLGRIQAMTFTTAMTLLRDSMSRSHDVTGICKELSYQFEDNVPFAVVLRQMASSVHQLGTITYDGNAIPSFATVTGTVFSLAVEQPNFLPSALAWLRSGVVVAVTFVIPPSEVALLYQAGGKTCILPAGGPPSNFVPDKHMQMLQEATLLYVGKQVYSLGTSLQSLGRGR